MRSLRTRLHDVGFVHLHGHYNESTFIDLTRELGVVVDDTLVRVVPGKRTYLSNPAPIPFHTDHPKADLIAWRCDAQDDADGASLLVDGAEVVARLEGKIRGVLSDTLLPAMVKLGDDAQPTPIIDSAGESTTIFYAPWLEPIGKPAAALPALAAFRHALAEEQSRAHRIRLEPGQILIANNRRMLHGRDALLPTSTRRLRRLWIGTS